MKTKIEKSLKALELENVVSRKDGYQEIINLIAKVRSIVIKCIRKRFQLLAWRSLHKFMLHYTRLGRFSHAKDRKYNKQTCTYSIQGNFSGLNTFGTMKICSRQGWFELVSVNHSSRTGG